MIDADSGSDGDRNSDSESDSESDRDSGLDVEEAAVFAWGACRAGYCCSTHGSAPVTWTSHVACANVRGLWSLYIWPE